jgi:hypothetical protein
MENGPLIDDLPLKNVIVHMLHCERVIETSQYPDELSNSQ